MGMTTYKIFNLVPNQKRPLKLPFHQVQKWNTIQNVILHIRIIVLTDLLAMILPIGDPGFESREVGEIFQTPEVPTQIQEAPTHILERAELSHSNQQQSFPPEKLGGKLKHFLSKWESITDDPWILSVIRQGLELEFMVEPSHQGSPPQINMNSTQKLAINKEIKCLLAIGCIKEIKRTERLFLSNIFTVPKKNGDLRLVINLKDLNQFLAFHHFKMESFQTAKDLIQEGDWMIKLDLKEAYHSVPVTPDHQRYLAFLWDGKCYVYCVLSFGLGPAPRVFTKITKPILVHIRQNLVIRCVTYSDDLLIFERTKSDCLQKAKKVMTQLQELGFTINIKKSILEPTKQIEFLGLILDSIQMKVFLPEPKVLDLIESCQAILSMRSLTARFLASLQGKMSCSSCSSLHAVLPAPTFYRAIQADTSTKQQAKPSISAKN